MPGREIPGQGQLFHPYKDLFTNTIIDKLPEEPTSIHLHLYDTTEPGEALAEEAFGIEAPEDEFHDSSEEVM